MSEDIIKDEAKLRQGLFKALECVAAISSAAAVVNPIFGLAGALIRMVLHHMDDEDICKLKREFGSINGELDKISQQTDDILVEVRKAVLEKQYESVENNLRHQYEKFMKAMKTPSLLKEFKQSYATDLYYQNMYTLYEGVMGTSKLFGLPILDVIPEQSQHNRATMEQLSKRLIYLFYIGLIALIGYATVSDDDVEKLKEEWANNMEKVQKKIQEVLCSCN